MARLLISADTDSKPRFHLPWNYHLSFQSFMYEAIGEYEPELASKLHQHKHAPPFSFSEFIPTGPFSPTDSGLLCERGYWVVGSDDDRIIDAVANYAKAKDELTIGNTQVPVVGVEISQVNAQVDGATRYKTLSPIAVSTKGQGEREWLQPSDPMWFSRLQDNLLDRVRNTWGVDEDAYFRLTDVHWSESKLLRVSSEAKIPCTRLSFSVEASEDLVQFFELRGLGEKTGMGFGSVMKQDDIPAWWS